MTEPLISYNYQLNTQKIEHLNEHTVNQYDQYGRTPLMYAMTPDEAELLIQNGAKVNLKTPNGETALFLTRCPDIAKVLILNKANVNVRENTDGYTILMNACSTNNLELVRVLLLNGTQNSVNDTNNYGETALMLTENVDIVRLLIQYGANIHVKNIYGRSALFTPEYKIYQLLIELGVDENETDKCGILPLVYHQMNTTLF